MPTIAANAVFCRVCVEGWPQTCTIRWSPKQDMVYRVRFCRDVDAEVAGLAAAYYDGPECGRSIFTARQLHLVMPEFRQTIHLPVTRLSRQDLQILSNLITSDMSPECTFSLRVGNAYYKSKSIGELLANLLPSTIDNIEIIVHNFGNHNKINRMIAIHLRPFEANFWISSVDETWFKGKMQQIKDFFANHVPWYEKVRKYFLIFLVGMSGVSSWGGWFAFSNERYWMLGLFLIAFVLANTIVLRNGKLFPHTRIYLNDTRKYHWMNQEMWNLFLIAISTVATLGLFVIEIVRL